MIGIRTDVKEQDTHGKTAGVLLPFRLSSVIVQYVFEGVGVSLVVRCGLERASRCVILLRAYYIHAVRINLENTTTHTPGTLSY